MRFRTTLRGFARPRNWLVAVVPAAVVGGFLSLPARRLPLRTTRRRTRSSRSAPRRTVEAGLEWLKKVQAQDGHWEAPGGAYKTAMTGLAGMCFLMEGAA